MQINLQGPKADKWLSGGGGDMKGQENKITKGYREILGGGGYFHFLDDGDKFILTLVFVCENILYTLCAVYCSSIISQ